MCSNKKMAALAYLAFTGLIGIVVYMFYLYASRSLILEREKAATCLTRDCINSAARLIASRDWSVNPCNDFYAFACGEWTKNNQIPDGSLRVDEFQKLTESTMHKFRAILEDGNSELLQPKEFYKACMNEYKLDLIGVKPMLKQLHLLGMPHVPSAKDRFPWQKVISKAEKSLGDSIFFSLDVIPHPLDTSKHVIQVRQGNFNDLPATDEKKVKAVEDFIADFIDLLIQNAPSNNKADSKEMAADLHAFHEQLRNLMTNPDAEEDQFKQFQEMTLVDLQNRTDSNSSTFIWKEYFNDVFDGLRANVDQKTLIIVRNEQFLKRWSQLLMETDPETIELYVWWRVFSSLAPYTIYDFRYRKEELLQTLTGNRYLYTPRWKTCVEMVSNAYKKDIASAYVKKHFNKTILPEAMKLKGEIYKAVQHTLKNRLEWMDEPSKNMCLEKIKAVKVFFGSPNSTAQNELYPEFRNMDMSKAGLFKIHLTHLAALEKSKLNLLDTIPDRNGDHLRTPTDLNVFYDERTNSIHIPSATLQPPFFSLGIKAMDYGAMGALIAQGYVHAVDRIGRQYDLHGNLKQLWTNKTLAAYKKQKRCHVDHDSLFLGENFSAVQNGRVAGVAGLLVALDAFNNLKYKQRGVVIEGQADLPGLRWVPKARVFFYSFANMFCSHESTRGQNANRLRVLNTVSNMEEFGKAWSCRVGSNMNPANKCVLW